MPGINLADNILHTVGRCVHARRHFAQLLNHAVNLLLVVNRHISHHFGKSIHVGTDVFHIDETLTQRLLHFRVAKHIVKSIGNVFQFFKRIAGRTHKSVKPASGNTFNPVAVLKKSAYRTRRRLNIDKFFSQNTIRINGKRRFLRNAHIVVNFGGNFNTVLVNGKAFNGAYLHPGIAHHVALHQPGNLRVIYCNVVLVTAKAECSQKGYHRCQNCGSTHGYCAYFNFAGTHFITCSLISRPSIKAFTIGLVLFFISSAVPMATICPS